MEKLGIHMKLKKKIAERRGRKFDAVHRLYLQKKDAEHEEEHLRVLLNKRRDIVFEICTRSYEEERRKAEEEFVRVSHFPSSLHGASIISVVCVCTGKREDTKCRFFCRGQGSKGLIFSFADPRNPGS